MKRAVLLVDDDPLEAELVRAALGGDLEVELVRDGDAALARLRDAPPPRLVLLDLKMGGANGFDVLARVRTDAALAGLPVVVLSSSCQPGDVERALALGADAYLVKPMRFEELAESLGRMRRTWVDGRDARAARRDFA